MYARAVKYVLGPDTKWEAEHIANVISGMVEPLPGFMGIQFLHHYETGEYEWISYWETLDAWDSSYVKLMDAKREVIGSAVQWSPSVQLFEVYYPKPVRTPKPQSPEH